MAIVKVNRELLTDIVADLEARHDRWRACCLTGYGMPKQPCPTAQRLERIKSAMSRDEGREQAKFPPGWAGLPGTHGMSPAPGREQADCARRCGPADHLPDCPFVLRAEGLERAGFEGGFESADSRAADSKPERKQTGCVVAGCSYSASAGSSYCTLHVVKWGREADPLPPSEARPEQEPHQYQWLGNTWCCLSCDVQIRNRDCPHNLALAESATAREQSG